MDNFKEYELPVDNNICIIHYLPYTKICECDRIYCDTCSQSCECDQLQIDDWKSKALIEMNKFEDKLNNKIKE
jgi:hypothetical protein